MHISRHVHATALAFTPTCLAPTTLFTHHMHPCLPFMHALSIAWLPVACNCLSCSRAAWCSTCMAVQASRKVLPFPALPSSRLAGW